MSDFWKGGELENIKGKKGLGYMENQGGILEVLRSSQPCKGGHITPCKSEGTHVVRASL